jgi:hypothetical protein
MAPRDTRTGDVLERMVLPALELGGYSCKRRITIGKRFGARKHVVDAIAEKGGAKILVSLKWQQVSGTAEQKIPFEVMCLAEAVEAGEFLKAYVVLGGDGWTLRELYTRGVLDKYLRNVGSVHVISLERFIAMANQGKL